MKTIVFAFCNLLILLIQAQKRVPSPRPSDVQSVRHFVQRFYDWYGPKASTGQITPIGAMKTRAKDFGAGLRQALAEFLTEQQKVKDLKVNFQSDPFQEWGGGNEHYRVVGADRKGDSWIVTLRGPTNSFGYASSVQAKVEKASNGWCFTNFQEGTNFDLLNSLKEMKKSVLRIETFMGGQLQTMSPTESKSVRRFAQGFYTWYSDEVARELNGNGVDVEHVVLTKKSAWLAPRLHKALLEDWTAQEKVQGEIVGIDFDPFVGGQDPARHYFVRKIERRGPTWLVYVWSSYGNQTHMPDVIAKVERCNGKPGWRFVDMLYPDGFTLLDVLGGTAQDRESDKH